MRMGCGVTGTSVGTTVLSVVYSTWRIAQEVVVRNRNPLRELLNEGKPTIGTQTISVSPQVVEVIGHTWCFDYVQLSGEYASWTAVIRGFLGAGWASGVFRQAEGFLGP